MEIYVSGKDSFGIYDAMAKKDSRWFYGEGKTFDGAVNDLLVKLGGACNINIKRVWGGNTKW